MTQQRLYKDMIRDTRLWSLYLALDRDHIDVMAYCPLEDHSLFTATVPLEVESTPLSTAVEEAVYDNPLLLNDFKQVTVINRESHYTLIPTPIASSDRGLAADILSEISGPVDNGVTLFDSIPLVDLTLCHSMDGKIHNFLCRTFNNPGFTHRLSVLARYFHGTNRNSGMSATCVNLRRGSLDVVIYRGDTLLLVNTYEWSTDVDALYFIAAARSATRVADDTPVLLSGDRTVREELTPLLRKYIPSVMPSIFPTAMFRAGGQTAMNTPTDLILTPLCE